MRTDTKKLAIMSLFVAIALALNVFEKMLPISTLVAGVKLGFSNIITIISLVIFGYKDTFMILVSRVILGSIFGGGVSGFLYSISGGMFSLIAMSMLMIIAKDRVSLVGISVTGAFFHSVGQLMMAVIMFQNIRMLGYLPIMLISSIVAGVFIGMVGEKLRPRLYSLKI